VPEEKKKQKSDRRGHTAKFFALPVGLPGREASLEKRISSTERSFLQNRVEKRI